MTQVDERFTSHCATRMLTPAMAAMVARSIDLAVSVAPGKPAEKLSTAVPEWIIAASSPTPGNAGVRVLLLHGPAGCGKSMYLQSLEVAQWKAWSARESPNDTLAPLYIALDKQSRVSGSQDDDPIRRALQRSGMDVNALLQSDSAPRWLVILDGYDGSWPELVDMQVADLFPYAVVVVACRTQHWEALNRDKKHLYPYRDKSNVAAVEAGVTDMEIQPCTDAQIKQYFDKVAKTRATAVSAGTQASTPVSGQAAPDPFVWGADKYVECINGFRVGSESQLQYTPRVLQWLEFSAPWLSHSGRLPSQGQTVPFTGADDIVQSCVHAVASAAVSHLVTALSSGSGAQASTAVRHAVRGIVVGCRLRALGARVESPIEVGITSIVGTSAHCDAGAGATNSDAMNGPPALDDGAILGGSIDDISLASGLGTSVLDVRRELGVALPRLQPAVHHAVATALVAVVHGRRDRTCSGRVTRVSGVARFILEALDDIVADSSAEPTLRRHGALLLSAMHAAECASGDDGINQCASIAFRRHILACLDAAGARAVPAAASAGGGPSEARDYRGVTVSGGGGGVSGGGVGLHPSETTAGVLLAKVATAAAV